MVKVKTHSISVDTGLGPMRMEIGTDGDLILEVDGSDFTVPEDMLPYLLKLLRENGVEEA